MGSRNSSAPATSSPMTAGSITSGGHNGSGVGTRDATVFDPATQQWTALSDLTYARWYPSLIQLADGRALTLGGAISRPVDCGGS